MDHQEGQTDRSRRRGRAGRYRGPKLGYQMPIQIAVHGDAKATAEALLAELDRRGMTSPKAGRRSEAMRERISAGDNHHFPHPDKSSAHFIDPRTLSKAVDAILPLDRVVASDSGHFCGWVPRYLRVPNARASCLSHSFQSVGLGLPRPSGLPLPIRASSRCSAPATAAS